MGSFSFSRIFFASTPPHPTSSPSGTNGDRKFWVPPPINNLEKKPCSGCIIFCFSFLDVISGWQHCPTPPFCQRKQLIQHLETTGFRRKCTSPEQGMFQKNKFLTLFFCLFVCVWVGVGVCGGVWVCVFICYKKVLKSSYSLGFSNDIIFDLIKQNELKLPNTDIKI